MTVAIFPTASWLDDPRNVWIPVEHGKKGTRVAGWDSDPPPPMSIAPGQNRALRLDHYTDLDLDCSEAVRAAEFLALATGVYFGRPSGLTAHLLYDAPGSEPAKFKDVDNRMLVELRAGRNHYTVLPDSFLAATDGKPAETLCFFRKGEIGRVNARGLRESARSIATAALLGRHWPEPGSRHEVAGLAAGFLVRQKVPVEEVAVIIQAAATIAGDEAVEDRVRFARDTCAKFQAGGRVTGGPKLAQVLDARVVDRLREWYGAPREAKSGLKGRSHTTKLVNLVLQQDAVLFCSPEGDPHVTLNTDGHRVTFSLTARSFRTWLSGEYFSATASGVSGSALKDATTALVGAAYKCGAVFPVYNRVAAVGPVVYLDLGRADRDVLAISADGWRITAAPADVRFVRRKGMLGLPNPVRGRALSELLPTVINVSGDNLILVIAWSVQALRGAKPFPILVIIGEHGAAKTYVCRSIRRLIDANVAELSLPPKEPRDLMITTRNSHVIGFDNLSAIPEWLSDPLCCVATGAGFRTRTLHTDDEEMIFSAARPQIINGITNLVHRGDLMDRCLFVELDPISEERRRTEADVDAAFAAAHPELLAALADAVAQALREPVKLERLPRMADFAVTVESAAPALGWKPGEFLRIYAANREGATDAVLDGDTLVDVLEELGAHQQRGHTWKWEGTSPQLMETMQQMNLLRRDGGQPERPLPKNPKALINALRRLLPLLRKRGYEVTLPKGQERSGEHRGKRLMTIEHRTPQPAQQQLPSE